MVDVIGSLSMIVGSLSDIVGLAVRILSINVGSRTAMLSVSRDYVISPQQVGYTVAGVELRSIFLITEVL